MPIECPPTHAAQKKNVRNERKYIHNAPVEYKAGNTDQPMASSSNVLGNTQLKTYIRAQDIPVEHNLKNASVLVYAATTVGVWPPMDCFYWVSGQTT